MKDPAQKRHGDPLWVVLAGLLISVIMRVLYYTGRKRFFGTETLKHLLETEKFVILATWHNRTFLVPLFYLRQVSRGRRMLPMASASKDGGLAHWAMMGFGITCVRGSTAKKGAAGKMGASAFRQMLRESKDGRTDLAFTPDGPRGPQYQVQEGVLLAAQLTGAPIVGLSYQANWRWRLKSWDRYILPKPFSRLNFVVGSPVYVDKFADNAELAACSEILRKEMRRIDGIAGSFDTVPGGPQ